MSDPILGNQKKLDPNDPNPCSGCSYCCEYIALEIDTPTTVRDFDNIYWYLIHKNVWIYIGLENDWHIQFNTPCEKLEGHLCGHYSERPIMCRSYAVRDCTRYGSGSDEKVMFKNEIDYFDYLSKRRPAIFKKLKERTHLEYPKAIPKILASKEKNIVQKRRDPLGKTPPIPAPF